MSILKKMNGRFVDKLIGKYCKIVTKKPGDERANVTSGVIKDVDYDEGFVIIESNQGIGCLNIKAIVAIKPKKQNRI